MKNRLRGIFPLGKRRMCQVVPTAAAAFWDLRFAVQNGLARRSLTRVAKQNSSCAEYTRARRSLQLVLINVESGGHSVDAAFVTLIIARRCCNVLCVAPFKGLVNVMLFRCSRLECVIFVKWGCVSVAICVLLVNRPLGLFTKRYRARVELCILLYVYVTIYNYTQQSQRPNGRFCIGKKCPKHPNFSV